MKEPTAYDPRVTLISVFVIATGTIAIVAALAFLLPPMTCGPGDPSGPRIGGVIRLAGCP